MGLILLIAFVLLPMAEISVFIWVGERIGVSSVILLCLLAAFAGSALMRAQGLAALRRAQASLDQKQFPTDELFNGICILLAGALLVLPGFVSDAIGLLLFLPPFRRLLRRLIGRWLAASGRVTVFTDERQGPPVIEVEYEDVTRDQGPDRRP
jgi:UPF0716 protein FxsA